MEQFGVIIGIGLLMLTTSCVFLLGRKAARNVERFREDNHVSFLGGKK